MKEKLIEARVGKRTVYAPLAPKGIDCPFIGKYDTGSWRRRYFVSTELEDVMAMLKVQVLISFVVCGLALSSAAHGQSLVGQGIWTRKASMPMVRGEVAAAVAGGKLFVIGGSVDGRAIPRVEAYDPGLDRWEQRAPMPVARNHLGIAVAGGKIYSFGGFTHSTHQGPGTDAFEYEPVTDRWRKLMPVPEPLGSVGAAVLDGKIHLIGGRGLDGKTLASHLVYDPATERWSQAAPLRTARDHQAVVAANGRIHAIGGRLGATVDRTGQHDVYDPATDSWQSAAPLKTPRSSVAAALYHGMIIVDGGEWPVEGRTHTENEGYDLKTDAWVSLAPLPEGRHGFGAGVIGNNLYFVGGYAKPGAGEMRADLLMFTLQ